MNVTTLASGLFPVPSGEKPGRRWLALLLPVLCAVLAALLMPHPSAFPYRFAKDQPWNYRSLKAPFDFEVLRPEAQIKDQLEQLKTTSGPYFQLNMDLARQQKRRFAQLLEEQKQIGRHDTQYSELVRNSGVYLAYGQQLLEQIFSRGIADADEPAFRENPGFIYVLSGVNERQVPVREVLTLRSALKFLTDTLPYSPLREPELMLPMLEKVLRPNLFYSDSLTLEASRKKRTAVAGTGVTVRKGEVIVQRNELISNEIYQKLDSLSRRYDTPDNWAVLAGYALLALIGFGLFFFWLSDQQAFTIFSLRQLLFLPVLVLLALLAIRFADSIGPALPLLIPLQALPVLLRRSYSAPTGIAVWALLIFLTTVSMNWDGAWPAVQATGLLGVLWMLKHETGWSRRLMVLACTAGLQILVCVGAGLAGRLPGNLQTGDAALFLGVASLLSLGIFSAGRLLERTVGTVDGGR